VAEARVILSGVELTAGDLGEESSPGASPISGHDPTSRRRRASVIGEGTRAILNDQPDFWVETATDVNSAAAALDARHDDIVISEIRLQECNAGLDLLRQRRMDGSAFIMFSVAYGAGR